MTEENAGDLRSAQRRPIGGWLVAVALAIALRVVWGGMVPVVPVSDGLAYDTYARNLARFNEYCLSRGAPSAYWPVGTPFIYSVLYRLFGEGYGSIVVLNVVLGALTTLLILEVGTRWFGARAGLVAGILFACWPGQVEFTTILASELLFNFFVLLAIFCWTRKGLPTWGDAVLTGVALAAGSYVRPLALVLPAVFVIWTLVRGRWVVAIARGVVAAGVMLVLILPWTVRNYLVFHSVVLVSTNGGANLWMGNSPGGRMEHVGYRELPPRPAGMNEAQFDQHLGKIAKTYIRQEPEAFARRCAKRVVNLYDRENIGVDWNVKGLGETPLKSCVSVLKYASTAYWWAMLAAAVVGLGILLGTVPILRVILNPAVLMWGYFTAVHAVTVSNDRYHFPDVPFMAMLGGMAVARLLIRGGRS